jgi:hypothetical protein
MTAIKTFGVVVAALTLPPAVGASHPTLTATAAMQTLGVSGPDAKATFTTWNGRPTVFVEYLIDEGKLPAKGRGSWDEPPPQHVDINTGERDKKLRVLAAVQRTADGKLHPTIVTDAGSDFGSSAVSAFGFANADRDAEKELIVIVQWEFGIYDVGGMEYQVRIFKQPDPSKPNLAPLQSVSDHFGYQCDCHFRDGRREYAKFKTIKAVQRELRRLGY